MLIISHREAITRSAAQPTAIATGSDDNNTDHVVHPPTQVTSAPVETEPDNRWVVLTKLLTNQVQMSPRPEANCVKKNITMQQTGTGVNTIHPTLRASLSGTFLQTLPDLVTVRHKLQALVYDIFPSTTAVFSYAIDS